MIFERAVELQASIDACFAFHERPGALSRLIPPWEAVTIRRTDNSLEPGSEVLLETGIFGMNLKWLARHEALDRPKLFIDRQVSGPFAAWRHEHRFESIGPGSTKLVDRVEYTLPFGKVGAAMGRSFIERKLNAMFDYRHRITRQDLDFARVILSVSNDNVSQKKIAVTGSNGLIGSHVVSLLSTLGHQVIRIERSAIEANRRGSADSVRLPLEGRSATSIFWNPRHGLDCPEQLDGIDAVIHLAGKGIGDGRWTKSMKAELTRSRVEATTLLAQQLSLLAKPPKAFVSASGVGIYGHRGESIVDESEPAGDDFLGKLAWQWEQASKSLVECGTRVCIGRLGVVLTPKGGALAKMLPMFRFGLGGRLGSGKQYWSWIGHEDAASALVWLALNPRCQGPYNLAAGSVANKEFTRVLARTLRRPAFLPVPEMVLRIAMGEMADGLLLNSTRVIGSRLLASGYPMRQIDLSQTFHELLGVHRA